eukprot:2474334-Pleurochrysis_carterae.AAC.1
MTSVVSAGIGGDGHRSDGEVEEIVMMSKFSCGGEEGLIKVYSVLVFMLFLLWQRLLLEVIVCSGGGGDGGGGGGG